MKKYCILVFCYDRANSLNLLIESLRKQNLNNFDLVIFSDGARNETEQDRVNDTRNVINLNIDLFDRVVSQEANIGLRRSILNGCNWASENYDGFVVL